MGSVQSGKTASLIGVVAKSLDRGVDIVVVLAGTRLALWKQTYERISSQLDTWTEASDSDRRLKRVFLPNPAMLIDIDGLPPLDSLYFEMPNLVLCEIFLPFNRGFCRNSEVVIFVICHLKFLKT